MWRSLKGSGYLGAVEDSTCTVLVLALVLLMVNRILGAILAPIGSAGRAWRSVVFHGRVVVRRFLI